MGKACDERGTDRPLSHSDVEHAWENLLRWGDQVCQATGITEADIERAIREYRREKAGRP